MKQGFFEALLGRVAAGIDALARGLKARLAGWLKGRKTPKNPESAAQLRRFDRPYLETLSQSLKEVTGQEIDPEDLRRMRLGDVSLSQRLYRQHVQTAARVRQILTEHTKYAHDSRKLALDLYEGYGFREREVLVPKVRLPKYLEQARLNREMDALMARIQATRLKTPALRAGYVQMLDAILDGAGQEAIDKALDVAVHERYRYFANRIAQTELARAQNIQTSRELMADETVEVVRVRLSAGHLPDLCDAFAKVDRYGLGAGCYPKALAPRPVFHPFCRCTLSAELFATATHAHENPEAIAAYLRTLDPKTAARVAGSRAKRDEILQGANAEALWNAKRPQAYKIGRVGDVTTLRQSGAGRSRWEADAEYDAIRARRDDVDLIARNTGIKPANIQRVKDHVFNTVYLLDRYAELGHAPVVARLQSDPAIAGAWTRLIDGRHTDADLQLLRHETAEAWYMRRHGPSYNAGHRAADARYPAPEFEEEE